jgi:hypothetical protein
LGSEIQQREFSPYTYKVNLSRSDQLLWTTVNNSEHGTTAMTVYKLNTSYPPFSERWTGDGATTDYTMSIPRVAGGSAIVTVNDVVQAETTDWSISGSTLTFVAAPASDSVIVAIWEIDESNVQ